MKGRHTNSQQHHTHQEAHTNRAGHTRNASSGRHTSTTNKQHLYAAYAAVIAIAGIFGLMIYFAPQSSAQLTTQTNPVIANATTTPPGPDAYAHVSLIGKAAIVYDLTNGQTLYALNSNESLPLASVTKLLTLYAAAGILSPASTVTMTATSLAAVNDTADTGFKVGESFTFEDLARLTLAASSNDGAEAIAEAAEAADPARASDDTSLLASAATAMNLTQTHATNASGLDINDQVSGGYGSAHDIAVLAGALLQKAPLIAQATTEPFVSIKSTDGVVHSFANTDIDVTHIPDPLLSKTGYTDLAGGNLVVVYDAAINHPVAIVVLGSTENGRFTDVQELVNATLAHFGDVTPRAASTAPVTPTT